MKLFFGGQCRNTVGLMVVQVFYPGDGNGSQRSGSKPTTNQVSAISNDNHKSADSGLLRGPYDMLEERQAAERHERFRHTARERCNWATGARGGNLGSAKLKKHPP